MPTFKYVTKDQSGKTIAGSVEANDRNGAISTLRKKDLIIISGSEAIPKVGFFSFVGPKTLV